MDTIRYFLKQQGKRANAETFNERVREAQSGSLEARNWCVEQNIGLVIRYAGKYGYQFFEEVFQEGVIGVMRALETFDTDRGLAFSTYAVPWIKQRQRRFWEDNRHCVRFPNYLIQLNYQYSKLKSDNPEEDDRFYLRLMARQHSIKTGQTLSPETILWATRANSGYVSIDKPIEGEEGQTSYHEILEAMTDLRVEHNNLINFSKLFKVLTYREKFVLMERANGMSLAECGELLELSREMARQIQKTAILKVRAAIRQRENSHLFKNKQGRNNNGKIQT